MTKDKKAAKLEKHLLKTQFPKECEQLPLDALSDDEKIVVTKCMDHDDLTDDEFRLLKKTLQKYRKLVREYAPNETVEAMEKTVQIINTEQELLDILDDETNKFLKVHLTYNSQVYELDFEILPIDDSRVVDYLQMNVDLFKDYSGYKIIIIIIFLIILLFKNLFLYKLYKQIKKHKKGAFYF